MRSDIYDPLRARQSPPGRDEVRFVERSVVCLTSKSWNNHSAIGTCDTLIPPSSTPSLLAGGSLYTAVLRIKGVSMDPTLVEQIQALLDKYGWAALITAMAQVAEADGFAVLTSALVPIHPLLEDSSENGWPAG